MQLKYNQSLSWGLVLLLVCGVVSSANAQNVGDIVFEYGFEEGVDTTGAPPGGRLVDFRDSTAVFILEEEDVHSGNYAFSVRNDPDTTELSARVDIPIPELEYGGYYELSVWVKTDITEGGFQPRTSWNNAVILGPVGGQLDWAEHTSEFQFLGGPESELWLHVTGNGPSQVWFDDVKITKVGDPQTDFLNPSFEEPNADATGPAHWEGQPNLGTGNPDRYVWDDTESHTGNYSALIQVTDADIEAGSIDAAWRTNYPFQNGVWYEFSAWVKTEDLGTTSFYFNMVYTNERFATITEDTDGWVYVVDTLQYGADVALNNPYRTQFRYRLGGSIAEGTSPKVWLDDVSIKPVGRAPAFSDDIVATANGDGTVTVSWKASPNADQARYHILMQPTSRENNLVTNPGFEIPNEAGDFPAGWRSRELGPSASGHEQLADAEVEWPAEDTPPGGGNFSMLIRSEDLESDKGAVVYVGQNISTEVNMAYWFSTWIKTENLFVPAGKIYSETLGDSLWKGGATIQTWTGNRSANSDPWIQSLGYNTVVGTTDWQEVGIPLTETQMTYYNNFVAVGIGEFPSWGASGMAWFDNVSVVPFDAVGSTTATEFTITDVPEGVDYIAVYAEDDVDGPDVVSRFNVSPAFVAQVTTGTAAGVEELPEKITLGQNYPNPFNPTTTIEFSLPQTGPVTLAIFDVLGRRVTTLVQNQVMGAGSHRITFDASHLASGVYLYRLESGNQFVTRKMQLIK